jgi:hypothetical protein
MSATRPSIRDDGGDALVGLGCLTGTGTGNGELVPGPPDPVVGNARWRLLGSPSISKLGK